jgi:hypothetical protein
MLAHLKKLVYTNILENLEENGLFGIRKKVVNQSIRGGSGEKKYHVTTAP